MGARTESEQQKGISVQEHCVALAQTLRQRVSDPCAEGQESEGNETCDGTDDDHVLVVALEAPTYDLAVRLHGAHAVWVHVAPQRLHNRGAHPKCKRT